MIPTRSPIPYDPEAGQRTLDACAPPDAWADIVRGAGGSAPYLAGLFAREADWLGGIWGADPEATLTDLLDGIARIEGDPAAPLRVAKRRAAALVALCDLGGVWDTMQATDALTRLADAAVDRALSLACARQKGLPEETGLVAFAMGKMGAGELNYSSDIDAILLFDQARHDPGDYPTVRAGLVKAARLACRWLSDVTAEGYVFRTDLRLRPDPASTPIVLSMEAAERYYEGFGRTWERAAWIKARPCAGDRAAGETFLATMRPFVWRRHLDFAAVQDAHDMRLAIRDHKGVYRDWDVPGHDLKLGQGGIREIEFFTQTRQLIAGGRDEGLRVRGTLDGLSRLAAAGWVPGAEAEILSRHYLTLRDAEHRVQMVQDAQTHRLPRDPDGLRRIACLSGEGDPDRYVAGMREVLREVEAITDTFFRPSDATAPPTPDVPELDAAAARWPTYPALRSERGRASFERLRPRVTAALAASERPAEAVAAFDGFLRGLPAGVQLFALFEASPALIDLIVDICATSPDLARFLAANSDVFDAVLNGSFFSPLDRFDAPAADGDFETVLDALRLWHREAHFRIGVHLLRGLATPGEAGAGYAQLAEAALGAAWDAARAETERRCGAVPGLRLAALGMGSLGAGRLTARSDLDLVVLYDGDPDAVSDRKGLGQRQWAAKFTQTLITALTAPTGAGRLYEVDMRLRPSGRQGPVATSLAGFEAYQASEAWAWEHLALTRARAVTGDAGLREAAETARRKALRASRFSAAEVLTAVADMRDRLRAAGRTGSGLAVKSGPGRLQEIGMAAQANALLAGCTDQSMLGQLTAEGWLTEAERDVLKDAGTLFADVAGAAALLGKADATEPGLGGGAYLARTTGRPDLETLRADCDAAAERADAAIGAAVARGRG
ncbi:hypothetical protein [Jannaschia aquimarina]|uniref:GlnE protein n=1 Tax=Jannaschia aquimarina TaxID=935700 RepID=A0A0D1ELR4_9RHOB|nr:hypothetical protein [Jannaschia aquimarina]KIT17886.1 Glutamate-ammonia-ligase adenylyltransferase [Jannaschia aquimarina]SNT14103.1 glutamate-ammonia-ligase adenylyltransferase [Jannaschia aquimarina]